MTIDLATTQSNAKLLESILVGGDLAKLSAEQRLEYYSRVCQSVGLNPLTKPFEYITLNGKLTLYARRDATDQIRATRGISVTIVSREYLTEKDLYVVTAKATAPDGRTDESIGAVAIANLKGDGLANALMKCETKAKRRVTLSIAGMGWLDETEVETIPTARVVAVDPVTGEIPPQAAPHPAYASPYEEYAALMQQLKDRGVAESQITTWMLSLFKVDDFNALVQADQKKVIQALTARLQQPARAEVASG